MSEAWIECGLIISPDRDIGAVGRVKGAYRGSVVSEP